MLVDDNEIVRKGLREALEHVADFVVVGHTGEGGEALHMAEELLPDVILLDVLMPDKNGIDVCREITTALPEATVLMLTAFSSPEAMEDAMAAGAKGYLLKLWNRDQLLKTLRDVMDDRYRSLHSKAATTGRYTSYGGPLRRTDPNS